MILPAWYRQSRVVEVIPAKELWLMKNKEALHLVTAGIVHAQNCEFVEDPMEGHEYSWLEEVDKDGSS
jgi:hypothetical protein